MKKNNKFVLIISSFICLLSLVSCGMATEEELLRSVGKTVDGGSVLWSKFDGTGMQVWAGEESKKDTASLKETADGLEITIKSEGWWGMCFCNDPAVGAGDGPVTFDMSNVSAISFDAKASEEGVSMWISQSPKDSKPKNQKKIVLTTSFENKKYTLSNPGKECYGVFDLGGGDLDTTTKTNVVITIKNIKFLGADGSEVMPSRNK